MKGISFKWRVPKILEEHYKKTKKPRYYIRKLRSIRKRM